MPEATNETRQKLQEHLAGAGLSKEPPHRPTPPFYPVVSQDLLVASLRAAAELKCSGGMLSDELDRALDAFLTASFRRALPPEAASAAPDTGQSKGWENSRHEQVVREHLEQVDRRGLYSVGAALRALLGWPHDPPAAIVAATKAREPLTLWRTATDDLFQRLWSKAVAQDDYVKAEWRELERRLAPLGPGRFEPPEPGKRGEKGEPRQEAALGVTVPNAATLPASAWIGVTGGPEARQEAVPVPDKIATDETSPGDADAWSCIGAAGNRLRLWTLRGEQPSLMLRIERLNTADSGYNIELGPNAVKGLWQALGSGLKG